MTSAALIAMTAALAVARNTKEVNEDISDMITAAEHFHILMSLKKLIRLGLLNAEILNKTDENGWPILSFNGNGQI